MEQIVSDLYRVRRLVKVLLRVSHGTDCVRPTLLETFQYYKCVINGLNLWSL